MAKLKLGKPIDDTKVRLLQPRHYLRQGINRDYLDLHYDLSESLVLTSSDGGSGYEQSAFEELISGSKRHEHFLDNKKKSRRFNGAVRLALKKNNFTTHSGVHNVGIANA